MSALCRAKCQAVKPVLGRCPLLEINRHPVRSVDDYRRLTANAKAGDILALYIYKPESDSRALHTVKIE